MNERNDEGNEALEKERVGRRESEGSLGAGVDGSGRVRENAKRARARGARVDRVAKTTGSQVIIKCNQYFTYFSRKSEGRYPSIPYKLPRPPLPPSRAADAA